MDELLLLLLLLGGGDGDVSVSVSVCRVPRSCRALLFQKINQKLGLGKARPKLSQLGSVSNVVVVPAAAVPVIGFCSCLASWTNDVEGWLCSMYLFFPRHTHTQQPLPINVAGQKEYSTRTTTQPPF